jgi:sigma54-dependent transcription regulator
MQAAPYAIGRAWHNTWLGYAADFGIPFSVIQGILYLTVLFVSFKASRLLPFGSHRSIISIYILIFTVRDLAASHTSGHSALDAYSRWWMYGLLFAIYATLPGSKKSHSKAQPNNREPLLQRNIPFRPAHRPTRD